LAPNYVPFASETDSRLKSFSARCVQLNAQVAPSDSYLSMIECGKRIPSRGILQFIGAARNLSKAQDATERVRAQAARGSRPVEIARGCSWVCQFQAPSNNLAALYVAAKSHLRFAGAEEARRIADESCYPDRL